MPVFDWTRTEMAKELPDGSFTLAFDAKAIAEIDPEKGIALPGWDASYKPEELRTLLAEYRSVSEEALWRNLEYFLKAIIPVAEEVGVKMAMHPDDPPAPDLRPASHCQESRRPCPSRGDRRFSS